MPPNSENKAITFSGGNRIRGKKKTAIEAPTPNRSRAMSQLVNALIPPYRLTRMKPVQMHMEKKTAIQPLQDLSASLMY